MEKTMIKEVQKTICVHHWLIDAKNYGVCIKCGEDRQFPIIVDPGDMPNSTCWASVRARKRKANELREKCGGKEKLGLQRKECLLANDTYFAAT